MYLDVEKILALVESSYEYKLAVHLKELSKAGAFILPVSSQTFYHPCYN